MIAYRRQAVERYQNIRLCGLATRIVKLQVNLKTFVLFDCTKKFNELLLTSLQSEYYTSNNIDAIPNKEPGTIN